MFAPQERLMGGGLSCIPNCDYYAMERNVCMHLSTEFSIFISVISFTATCVEAQKTVWVQKTTVVLMTLFIHVLSFLLHVWFYMEYL